MQTYNNNDMNRGQKHELTKTVYNVASDEFSIIHKCFNSSLLMMFPAQYYISVPQIIFQVGEVRLAKNDQLSARVSMLNIVILDIFSLA